jgi:hypothetical protein
MKQIPKRKLTPKESRKIEEHLAKISEEIKGIQAHLESIGVSPVGGWKDPDSYTLVNGVKLSEDCDDCSVVCWDGACDCVECQKMESIENPLFLHSTPMHDRIFVSGVGELMFKPRTK